MYDSPDIESARTVRNRIITEFRDRASKAIVVLELGFDKVMADELTCKVPKETKNNQ